jgi:hypothetical protein
MVGVRGRFHLGESTASLQARLGPGYEANFSLGRHDEGGALGYGNIRVMLGDYYYNGAQQDPPTGFVEGFFGGDLEFEGHQLRTGDDRETARSLFPKWKKQSPDWDIMRADNPYVGVEYTADGRVKEISVHR